MVTYHAYVPDRGHLMQIPQLKLLKKSDLSRKCPAFDHTLVLYLKKRL